MSTQTFPVTGMTCGHCVSAVSSEIKEIPGVTDVNVDLVAGGTSTVTVTSDAPVSDDRGRRGPRRGRRLPPRHRLTTQHRPPTRAGKDST